MTITKVSTVMQDARNRIDQLVTELNQHNENYYLKYAPTISDQEYNKLYKELEDLEDCYPSLIRADSPTQWVEPRDPQASRQHVAPMYSLDNFYTETDVVKWASQFSPDTVLYADMKHDGMACELIYVAGILTYAVSRGDGRVGLDITSHVQKIPRIPKEIIPYRDTPVISVTGELTMTERSLRSVNLQLRDMNRKPLPNCRNAVSAIMRTLNPEQIALDAIDFQVYGSDAILKTCRSMTVFMEHMRDALGFKVREFIVCTAQDLSQLFKFYKHWEDTYRDMEMDHPIDGIVIKVDDSHRWDELGYTKKAPRFAKAFKFREVIKSAVIREIVHTVGKHGTITPTAILDSGDEKHTPIMIGGSEVRRANLVNTKNIHLHCYYPGAIVEVYKAGGSIPRLRSTINLTNAVPYEEPCQCSWCAGPLKREGAYLRCTNPDCDGVVIARLVFSVSRDCLNINSWGAISIASLVREENIRSLAAFLQFNYNYEDVNHPQIIFSDKDPIELKRVRMVKAMIGVCIPCLTEGNLLKLLDGATDDILLRQWKDLPRTLQSLETLSRVGITDHAVAKILEHAVVRHDEIRELVEL